jgi:predicted GNAT family N-acyltransferase
MRNAEKNVASIQIGCTVEEIAEIKKLRYEIYATELGLDFPEVNHELRIVEDLLDHSGIHLYAMVEGRMAGAVRFNRNRVPPGMEAILETNGLPKPFFYCSRLCIAKERRGTEVMGRLAQATFAEFSRRGAAVAICHCYSHLLKLYERMGFHPYGVPFVTKGLERLGTQTPLCCVLAQQDRCAA